MEWDLERLAQARGLGDWMYGQFSDHVGSCVVEIGAGIGTYSQRLLADGVVDLLMVEPEPACAACLRELYDDDSRCEIAVEALPDSPALKRRAGTANLAVCLNVLEHMADDQAALDAMVAALVPGGVVAVLVPAHPRLYNRLDALMGHERRYTRGRLEGLARAAGLEVVSLRRFNGLGVAGWVAKSFVKEPGLDPRSLRIYESILPLWRALEDRVRLPFGLSLVLVARKAH